MSTLSWATVAASLFHATASVFSGDLLAAKTCAVLGASTVTITGNTVLTGDLVVYAGTAITGFPPGIVAGMTYDNAERVLQQAQMDALAAFDALRDKTPTEDLGGLTLTSGVRNFSSSAQWTGTLTLDGCGNPGARFDPLIGNTLKAAVGSAIVHINGASPDNVFLAVGSSMTPGTKTAFWNTIIARASIKMKTVASLRGQFLARTQAASLHVNDIPATSMDSIMDSSILPETGWFSSLALLSLPVLGLWPWYARLRGKVAHTRAAQSLGTDDSR